MNQELAAKMSKSHGFKEYASKSKKPEKVIFSSLLIFIIHFIYLIIYIQSKNGGTFNQDFFSLQLLTYLKFPQLRTWTPL